MTQDTKSSMQWVIWIRNALLAIAILIMVAHVLIYLAFGVSLIPFPFDYDQAEGYELNNAILMAQGDCPYCDNNVFPFYGSGYPPFFHILMIPFVWLFGPAYWYGRLIIFVGTFVTAGAIAWGIRRTEKRFWIAILAGLAFLASNYVYHIGPLLRQHLLMVMFETLAVVIVANAFQFTGRQRHIRLFIAFLLLLFAGYTKQLAYSTCIAVTIWVFLRNPRTAILYGFGLIVAAAGVFAVGYITTEGGFFTNLISANQNPFVDGQYIGLLTQFLRLHWSLLLLSGLFVLYETYFDRISVYSIWFIVSLANTLLAGKWGAGDSYFVTAIAASCLLSGLFLARTLNHGWIFPSDHYWVKRIRSWFGDFAINSQMIGTGVGFLAIGLFIIYGLTVRKIPTAGPIFGTIAERFQIEPLPSWRYPLYDAAGWTLGYAVTGHLVTPEDYESGWEITRLVEQTDGLVMSEDAGFSIVAGRDVVSNSVQLNNMWQNNLYDPENLLQMIKNHEFGLIILRAEFFPPPINEAIQASYQVEQTISMNGFDYRLLRPTANDS